VSVAQSRGAPNNVPAPVAHPPLQELPHRGALLQAWGLSLCILEVVTFASAQGVGDAGRCPGAPLREPWKPLRRPSWRERGWISTTIAPSHIFGDRLLLLPPQDPLGRRAVGPPQRRGRGLEVRVHVVGGWQLLLLGGLHRLSVAAVVRFPTSRPLPPVSPPPPSRCRLRCRL
jgi:hypothetical protein